MKRQKPREDVKDKKLEKKEDISESRTNRNKAKGVAFLKVGKARGRVTRLTDMIMLENNERLG